MKEWVASRTYNVVAWAAVVILVALTVALTTISVREMLGG